MLRASCVLPEKAHEVESEPVPVEGRIAVYDGLRHVGDVVELHGAWAALDSDGEAIGRFGNREAATEAILGRQAP